MTIETVGTPLLWTGFLAFVIVMLALDLGVLHRRSREVSTRQALVWSLVWIAISLAFNGAIYASFGPARALEFLTGYLIEKALSIDNLFVFVVIFSYFGVAPALQHRVLFWGVLGALVMRAVFIVVGGALLQAFHWTIYLFGGLLLVTGVRLLRQQEGDIHPERNPVVRLLARALPVSTNAGAERFVVRDGGRWAITPLFLALVTVEVSDIVFAVDSIPAIFAVTTDPFIVFTSNIFAILGLRSLYFLLAGVIDRFRYLNVGLAAVLIFVGAKMVVVEWIRVPIALSLGIVAGLLVISVVASLALPGKAAEHGPSSGRGIGSA
jgi:tellurite resistance protein TerC